MIHIVLLSCCIKLPRQQLKSAICCEDTNDELVGLISFGYCFEVIYYGSIRLYGSNEYVMFTFFFRTRNSHECIHPTFSLSGITFIMAVFPDSEVL